MLLSTQTDALALRFGELEAIRMLAEAGFDALDYSMFSHGDDHPVFGEKQADHADWLLAAAKKHGLAFNQAHAPFPTIIEDDPAYNERVFPQVAKSIEMAGRLGADQIIVHPTSFSDRRKNKAENVRLYEKLAPHAAPYGIKIALENMWQWDASGRIVKNVCSDAEDFIDILDELDPKRFTACLDLGHCGLVGESAADMIRSLGRDRLTSLHVHDNDHQDDTHTLPYSGKMDWPAITRALADIDYAGDLTLEADHFMVAMPDEFLPAAVRFMQETGRQLMAMIDRARG